MVVKIMFSATSVSFPRKRALLSLYPVGKESLHELLGEDIASEATNISLSIFEKKNALNLINQLRAEKWDEIHIISDGAWSQTAPILTLVSLFMKGKVIVHVARHTARVTPLYIAKCIFIVATSFGRGLISVPRHYVRLKNINKRCKARVSKVEIKDAVYLKTNPWTTVQAGGSVAHTKGVIGSMLSHAHVVKYVSIGDGLDFPNEKRFEKEEIKLNGIPLIPRELSIYGREEEIVAWAKTQNIQDFGFIYHRLALGSYAAVILARLNRLPLVIEYNGSEIWIAENWGTPIRFRRLAQMAEDACLQNADLVVTVSPPLRDDLLRRGIDPSRILMHPNGFDPDVYRPDAYSPDDIRAVRRSLDIPDTAVVATFVGTFGAWHGAEVLAEALAILLREHNEWLKNSGLVVLFVGDGPNCKKTQEILKKAGCGAFSRFSGLVEQTRAPAYMAASDIFMAPHVPNQDGSEFFGSPTKLFEYLAMGKPVIASSLGQIAEVLDGSPTVADLNAADGHYSCDSTGILCTPGDAVELASALRYAVEHPQWRQANGKTARERALGKYTWGHHVGAILTTLKEKVN